MEVLNDSLHEPSPDDVVSSLITYDFSNQPPGCTNTLADMSGSTNCLVKFRLALAGVFRRITSPFRRMPDFIIIGLAEVYDFLGVELVYPHNTEAQEVGSYPELSAETRHMIESYFKKPNDDLVLLLGNRYRW